MAYDEQFAQRVRAVVGTEPGLTERRMFGGLAFLVRGNMSVTVSGAGGLLVRLEPAEADALRDLPGVDPFVMRERQMAGWLHVEEAALEDDAALEEWVRRSLAFVRTLPAKAS